MDNCLISPNTYAVVPLDSTRTKVIEKGREYIVNQTPYKIMEENCQYYGSTYTGREKGSKYILGGNYKLPIVVEEVNSLIFFPTISPSILGCIWFALHSIRNIEQLDDNNSLVIFNNNTKIVVAATAYSIEKQYLKAAKLNQLLQNRRKFN